MIRELKYLSKRRRKINSSAKLMGSIWFATAMALVVLLGFRIGLFIVSTRAPKKPFTMSNTSSRYHRIRQADAQAVPLQKTLSFSVCNGFANQRLSLLYGIVIAKHLERDIYLPDLIDDGIQYTTETNYGKGVPFESIYDRFDFIKGLATFGVDVLPGSPPAVLKSSVNLTEEQTSDLVHSREYDDYNHISLGCPLLRLPGSFMADVNIWPVLNALQPNTHYISKIARAQELLGDRYSFLHLRMEMDWIAHCARWKYGRKDDNCFTNTNHVAEQLVARNIDTDHTLYIAFDTLAAPMPLVHELMQDIKAVGYRIALHSDLFGDEEMPREVSALMEYYLALHSNRFIGNSVSTFSALNLLERQQANRWASYYNMGDIPLATFLPFYKMPWIFTYNGKSPFYDYMVKAAVISGIFTAGLTPYCLYNGSQDDSIFKWLSSNGVQMIQHKPNWRSKVDQAFETAKKMSAVSPLYQDKESIFGTMQRIDISVIPQLEEYNYVLFTDSDVFFQKPITLESFGPELPSAVSMAYEIDDIFPCNAGIILMNIPALRVSHGDLVTMAFSEPSLHFGSYGPMDQGAFNKLYEQQMEGQCKLSETFNSKPYKNDIKDAPIIHFHGPKPHHYMAFAASGKCLVSFGDLCQKGLPSVCSLMEDYRGVHPDVARDLPNLCDIPNIKPNRASTESAKVTHTE
jgi:hypothetical protein